MKRVIITSVMLILSIFFMLFHYHKVSDLDMIIDNSYDTIIQAYKNEDFDKVSNELEKLKQALDNTQTWIGMTVDTDQLEEIEISLLQSLNYAEIEANEDFIGEFILFNQLIKHLPYYEKLTLESLF